MDELTIERINNERQRYVDFFAKTIDTLKADKETFATELPIKVNDLSIPEPFDIIRVDFIYKNENGEHAMSEIRLSDNLKYDRLNVKIKGSEVSIRPFCWNSCEITGDYVDKEGLKNWVYKWIKIDNEMAGQVSEAIHSCTFPNHNKFNVDFGTSKGLALLDLIDTLTATGTKKLIIETSVV